MIKSELNKSNDTYINPASSIDSAVSREISVKCQLDNTARGDTWGITTPLFLTKASTLCTLSFTFYCLPFELSFPNFRRLLSLFKFHLPLCLGRKPKPRFLTLASYVTVVVAA